MKTISTGLATLFASGNSFVCADLYTFTLSNGTVLRYTDFDVPVTYGGVTFQNTGPVLSRTRAKTVIGLEVDTMDIDVSAKDTDMIGSQTWMQAVCSGVLDGAVVSLDRAYFDMSLIIQGAVNIFYGNTAQIDIDRSVIKMTVNSPLDGLNIQMPRNQYQAGCQHTLFDSGCSANRASFTDSGTVSGSITKIAFAASISGASGRYNLGTLQFTSGVLSGTRRTVKTWDGTTITLLNPLPIAPSSGDAFTVTAGCNKTLTTCNGVFANQANFKGFPFVPVPETAI